VIIPSILRSFVREAPQYQHMPNHVIIGMIWRWVAGFIYFLKQQILYFQISRRRLRPLKQMKNSKKNIPVLIIGNGPSSASLTSEQIKRLRLQNAEVISMNNYDKRQISTEIIPEFHFLLDPEYHRADFEGTKSIQTYLESHPKIQLILSSLAPNSVNWTKQSLFVNGIQAVGLWKSDSPLKANTYTQGVIFSALKFAHFLGYSPIYVTGVDNSFYKHHFHNQIGEIFINTDGLHSYSDEVEGKYARTIPFLTRNMSDVLFAHAICLRDLRKFSKGKTIVNVGLSDHTNDAFPFGCLLH
jgi:hypothetical protein